MRLPDPDRLAAADLYGRSGDPRRRRLVRVEFVVGAALCAVLGCLSLWQGGVWIVFGVWLVGVAINYATLIWVAGRLCRPGQLEAWMSGRDVRAEVADGSRQQLWIVVPGALGLGVVAGVRARDPR